MWLFNPDQPGPKFLTSLGKKILATPRRCILMISAHWETRGEIRITARADHGKLFILRSGVQRVILALQEGKGAVDTPTSTTSASAIDIFQTTCDAHNKVVEGVARSLRAAFDSGAPSMESTTYESAMVNLMAHLVPMENVPEGTLQAKADALLSFRTAILSAFDNLFSQIDNTSSHCKATMDDFKVIRELRKQFDTLTAL
ncbi:hypothetical protein BC829DRAFT_422142 [Chytridium lagenaria]|nr:hypothetical protein BC829DRAFT_422142 [Chytridium lagenaria]